MGFPVDKNTHLWNIWVDHDDAIKWKHFPRYWPFVRGIHRSPVNSPHKGQWRGAFMFSLICAWINGGVNNREAGDLRRHQAHYYVIVMFIRSSMELSRFVVVQSHGPLPFLTCMGLSMVAYFTHPSAGMHIPETVGLIYSVRSSMELSLRAVGQQHVISPFGSAYGCPFDPYWLVHRPKCAYLKLWVDFFRNSMELTRFAVVQPLVHLPIWPI